MPITARPFVASPPGSGDPPGETGAAGPDFAEFGILAGVVSDPEVTDVFVNGSGGAWVDRGDGLERVPTIRASEPELRALAVHLVGLGGRHVDEATPCVDARLAGGVRVHVVLPPISGCGTLVSVRLPRRAPPTLDGLAAAGFFERVPRGVVDALVRDRVNVLVTGAAGSGKTTLLAAMLASAPHRERIVALEDVAELRVDHPQFVALEARQPNLEGVGGIALDRLVREALRMRPDRLVVGECRGAELRELLTALNTGHDGGAGTLHANSLPDVPARLEALGSLTGLGAEAVARQTVSAIGAVLHIRRGSEGRRLDAVGRFRLDQNERLAIDDASE